jgi:DNA-binding response OmpR family regulator
MGKGEAERRVMVDSRRGHGPEEPSPSQVLVALGDTARAGHVARGLHAVGLVPTLAFTAEQACACLRNHGFELALVDVFLDRRPSREVVSVARRSGVPVVTSGTASADPDVGRLADDYVADDADLGEVVGRCLALVRISRPVRLPGKLRWGPLELDPRKRTGRWHGSPLKLTSIQFRILELLVLATGSVVTHAEFTQHIWGDQTFADAERILAHVRRIRKKIEADPSRPEFLLTVRGEGFRLPSYEVREAPIDLRQLEEDLRSGE